MGRAGSRGNAGHVSPPYARRVLGSAPRLSTTTVVKFPISPGRKVSAAPHRRFTPPNPSMEAAVLLLFFILNGSVASRSLAFSPLAIAGGYRPFITLFQSVVAASAALLPFPASIAFPTSDRIGSLASSAFSPLASGGGYRPFIQCENRASWIPASVD